MSSIRLLRVTAILLAFAPGVATAADEPTGWKLSEPFYLTAVQRSDFVNKFAGVEKPEKKATTFIFKVTPARKKGGGWLLTHRLEGLASEPKHPSIEAFASMVGGEFAVSLAADLRTHDVVDVDGLLAKLDPDGPVPEPVRKSLEPTLKHLMRVVLRDAYFPVPTHGGHSWAGDP